MTLAVPPRSVRRPKIVGYLLDPDHPVGGSKAMFFQAFGFSTAYPDELQTALLAHPDHNSVEMGRVDQYGARYVVRCHLETPDGRNPCIVSIWFLPVDEDEAQLVTAYPTSAA